MQNLSTAYQTATAELEKGLDGVLAAASEGGTKPDAEAAHSLGVFNLVMVYRRAWRAAAEATWRFEPGGEIVRALTWPSACIRRRGVDIVGTA